jgi:serine/threonine protein kinase
VALPADHTPDAGPSLHDRARELIEVLLSVPEDRREHAARLMCAGDADLLALVSTALSAAAQEVLLRRLRGDHETSSVAAAAGASAHTMAARHDEQPGATIGAYRLLERLGEGGFGEVYAAEQSEPIRRRVAIKIIKPGMDSRAVVARFEAERQALAMMDHPNIAKVLDAGTTPAGRPFFVMELVRGVPITSYCEENRLSPRERIELMIPVCQAIQHAHQKGIIHRDIKPGNVLVTILDGRAVPKVIDFGIAKAIAGASTLTDKTIYTAFRQFIGTPAYMSPEQILQSGVDVDTRSDVYALGVLVYELLSGSLPFDTGSLLKEGLERMQQVVREQDPPKPSTRVMTMDAGKRTSIAAARRLQPDKLGGTLRGEVDWMVMKAVERDRNRRYQSPMEFAEDLRRYLDGDAVKASPPSGWYRARKFVRRNRVAVALGAVAASGLIATAVGTSIGLRREAAQRAVAVENERIAKENEARANEERDRAEKSARIARAAMDFLPSVLQAADPAMVDGRRDVTVAEMLDRAMAVADSGVDAQGSPLEPEVVLQARVTAASLYNWQGRPDKGRAEAAKALALAESTFGKDSLQTAKALGAVVGGYWFSTRNDASGAEGEPLARRRLAILEQHGQQNTLEYLGARHGLGLMLHSQLKFSEALELELQNLAALDAMPTPPGPPPLWYAVKCMDIALGMALLGRTEEALTYSQRGIEIHERMAASKPGDATHARPLTIHGGILADLGRLEEAEAAARRSMEIHDRLRGPDHPYPQFERRTLISILLQQGKFEEAKPLIARFDAIQKARNVPYGPDQLTRDAFIARRTGKHAQALAMWRIAEQRAFEGPKPLYSRSDPVVAVACADWLGTLTDLGMQAEGLAKIGPIYEAARERLVAEGHAGPNNTVLRRLAAELLRAYLAVGDEPSLAAARALREKYPGLEPAKGFAPAPR